MTGIGAPGPRAGTAAASTASQIEAVLEPGGDTPADHALGRRWPTRVVVLMAAVSCMLCISLSGNIVNAQGTLRCVTK